MLSERVEPEQLRDLFAFYRAAAREAVSRYSGYVMQYLGDGILAAFGYPEPHEDDARRAVLAGLDLGWRCGMPMPSWTAASASRRRSGSASTPGGWWSPTSATTDPSPNVTRSSAWSPTLPPGSSRRPSRAWS